MSTAICKDGQTTITANIPFGGNKITGLGAGTARTDAASLATIQDGTGVYVGTVGGTADVITLTPSPAITAYAAGQTFRFIASGANTTNVTVNVSGLGAKAITKNGTDALVAGDIPSGSLVEISYDGTRFQLGTIGAATYLPPFSDALAIVKGSADATKLLRFEVDGLTTATTRVATWPDKDGTVAMTSDIIIPVPRSYLAGYGLANNVTDATNDLNIAVGSASDSTNTITITLASALVKGLDENWAAGTNQGMRYSGAAIGNVTYGIWAVAKANGANVDIYAYPNAGAPSAATVLGALQAETGGADYLYVRRIGAILRESNAIVAFSQQGDEFLRLVPVRDVNNGSLSSTAVLGTMSVPVGLKVLHIGNWGMISNVDTANAVYVSSPDVTDVAASTSAAPLGQMFVTDETVGGMVVRQGAQVTTRTNTSAQVRYRAVNSCTGLCATVGWIDTRGRDD